MADPPEIDGRRRAELRERIETIAPFYLDEWDPDGADVGAALVELFAEMAGDLAKRLDRAPRKHRIAFYDALGFDRLTPQAATVPVSVAVDEAAPDNVAIPPGTEVEAETDTEPEIFRFGSADAFEATPARLTHVFSVDPAEDRLVAHHDAVGGTTSSTLFTDENVQANVLYIGDPEWLAISGGSSIVMDLGNSPDPTGLVWEYFGETEDEEESWIAFEAADEEIEWTGDHLKLTPSRPIVETEINGIESSWIRCQVPEDGGLYDMTFDPLRFAGEENSAEPEGLYANDVPQPQNGAARYPFGAIPQQRDTFYIACKEAFEKTGARVTIEFEGAAATSKKEGVRLSWEYFDGDAWNLLPAVDLGYEFDGDGDVQFTVPPDIASTSVFGQDGVWIRVRLVAGEYVNVTYSQEEDNGEWTAERDIDGDPPSFESLSITYTSAGPAPPATLLAENGLAYSDNLVEEGPPYAPFTRLPDTEQAAYFGFDAPLEDGPIQLYVDVDDRAYPEAFSPRVRWESCVEPDADEWAALVTRDETEGLTQSGIVSLSFADATEATSRFGTERHWLRARVRGDAFEPETDAELAGTGLAGAETCREPCRTFLDTDPGGRAAGRAPPRLDGIHPNTGLARNVTIVEDEILGSSDGSPNLAVSVSRPPTIEIEVWVDEATALTNEQVARLEAERPDEMSIETDSSGDLTAAWVQWAAVDDLATARESDRQFVLDRVAGMVSFGDGKTGRIPPHGRDNIRASYRTGGGGAGNIEPGAVGDVSTAIPHVDEVTNPVGGSGGADAEPTDAVLERAPKQLRDRNRAVTAVDYERIAMDAARGLAAVSCLQGMNRDGAHEPGWVTVLIVPDERQETPVPSVGLTERVKQEVSEWAPVHLVKRNRLVVRGPTYVPVHVEATVVSDGVRSLGTFETELREHLRTFLHPLSGRAGAGWPFGELPTISDVIADIEEHDGVDHVPTLRLHYEGTRVTETITAGERPPEVSPDVLVRSGAHELVVEPLERVCPEGAE